MDKNINPWARLVRTEIPDEMESWGRNNLEALLWAYSSNYCKDTISINSQKGRDKKDLFLVFRRGLTLIILNILV